MIPQRLDFAFHIDWSGDWHVGSGFSSASADRLLRRVGGVHGTPFVPGSQFKGVLRHQCERLALALGCEAVDPHATSDDQRKRLVTHFRPLADSALLVDRLFGNRYQGECLFVDNALPAADAGTYTTLRTRTAIDRVTGTVREGRLFTTEMADRAAPPLRGRVRGRHAAGVLTQEGDDFPFEYSLLIAALLTVDSLGGDKSTGLGRCHVSILDNRLRWNGEVIALDDALRSFANIGDEWADWVRMVREERRA